MIFSMFSYMLEGNDDLQSRRCFIDSNEWPLCFQVHLLLSLQLRLSKEALVALVALQRRFSVSCGSPKKI
jgi:hypothetical protein